jgi:MarR family transcriptional regulator, organic hydroperoxide resistance regulator
MNYMSTPVSKENMRAWISVVHTYQLCNDTLLERLKTIGLTLPQFDILVQLLREPKQSQQMLSERSFLVKSHISGLLAQMTEQGWIMRASDEADKRAKLVSLTPAGLIVAKKAAAIQSTVMRAMLAPLSEQQISDVETIMVTVAGALADLREK